MVADGWVRQLLSDPALRQQGHCSDTTGRTLETNDVDEEVRRAITEKYADNFFKNDFSAKMAIIMLMSNQDIDTFRKLLSK